MAIGYVGNKPLSYIDEDFPKGLINLAFLMGKNLAFWLCCMKQHRGEEVDSWCLVESPNGYATRVKNTSLNEAHNLGTTLMEFIDLQP